MFFIKGTNKSNEPRMNERIRAREIRVIGDDGEQFGILSVNEAIALAAEKNLDLVLEYFSHFFQKKDFNVVKFLLIFLIIFFCFRIR